uniref:Acetyl-coenzyme A transporter 1 n=2 Tax=Acrobeloides nanus TaxID=290746 RepID=A0A914CB71_9BILA
MSDHKRLSEAKENNGERRKRRGRSELLEGKEQAEDIQNKEALYGQRRRKGGGEYDEDEITTTRRRPVTTVPHNTEDIMAGEANFDGSGAAHMPFIYRPPSSKTDEEDEYELHHKKFSDEEGDSLKKSSGIPLGLIAAIPLILQSRNVTYGQQAVFSFAYWPFSLKLLWAPIVDALYCRWIGRRKSWMVPCQYLIGGFLLVMSFYVPEILGKEDDKDKSPNVFFLMCVFLPLNFLAATQDIAVDGWALTMLSRKNVGYASTCNVVGQTVGFFLGNVVFLTLESKEFANKWIRSVPQDHGIVDLAGGLKC